MEIPIIKRGLAIAAPPIVIQDLNDRVQSLRTKILRFPFPPGQNLDENAAHPADQPETDPDMKEACKDFVTGLDAWAGDPFDTADLHRMKGTQPTLVESPHSESPKRRQIQFHDHYGVLRTARTKTLRDRVRVLFSRSFSPHNSQNVSLETAEFLKAYETGTPDELAKRFLDAPTMIHNDLSKFSEGPIFDAESTHRIISRLQDDIQGNVVSNRGIFEAGIFVYNNHLLSAAYRKRWFLNGHKLMHFQASRLGAGGLPANLRRIHAVLMPEREHTRVNLPRAVSRHVVLFAMLSEGVLKAAADLSGAKEKRIHHVAYIVAYTFAVLMAALIYIPFNAVSAVKHVLGPIRNAILKKHGKKYSPGCLKHNYELELGKFLNLVAQGVIVPGLDNSLAMRSLMEKVQKDLTPAQQLIKQERIAWGLDFRTQLLKAAPNFSQLRSLEPRLVGK